MKNREIKFRAWDGGKYIIPKFIGRDGIAYWSENSITEGSNIIEQFTGLHDKNGKEIYEGDELQMDYEDGDVGFLGVVNFSDDVLGWGIGDNDNLSDYRNCLIEVIGNIRENPGLL